MDRYRSNEERGGRARASLYRARSKNHRLREKDRIGWLMLAWAERRRVKERDKKAV